MGDTFSIIIIMSVASIVLSAMSYGVGFKEGKREGYTRGRSVSRHISAKAVSK